MVVYNRGPEQVVKITRDIIPALEELAIQSPAASFITEAAKMQRQEYGDGVTQFTLLASALIMAAEELRGLSVHPNTIVEGYKKASRRANEVLEKVSIEIGMESRSRVLNGLDCGRGLLVGRLCEETLEASTLLNTNGMINPDKARFIREKGGEVSESSLVRGILLRGDKAHPGMPDDVEGARIAILTGGLANRVETKMRGDGPPEIEARITDPRSVDDFRRAQLDKKRSQVASLAGLGVNVLLSGQPLDDASRGLLSSCGIFAAEGVKKEDLEAVAFASGAKLASTTSDLSVDCLGGATGLSIRDCPPGRVMRIIGCGGASFHLRGSTESGIDDLEALLNNALKVMQVIDESPRAVPGGGAAEMEVSRDLAEYALGFPGKEQVVVEKFAEAVEEMPRILAVNNGLDPIGTIAELRRLHEAGRCNTGIGFLECSDSVCLDVLKVKKAVVARATDVAALMLGIDDLMISNEIAKFHRK